MSDEKAKLVLALVQQEQDEMKRTLFRLRLFTLLQSLLILITIWRLHTAFDFIQVLQKVVLNSENIFYELERIPAEFSCILDVLNMLSSVSI